MCIDPSNDFWKTQTGWQTEALAYYICVSKISNRYLLSCLDYFSLDTASTVLRYIKRCYHRLSSETLDFSPIKRCFTCQSVSHLQRNCQEARNKRRWMKQQAHLSSSGIQPKVFKTPSTQCDPPRTSILCKEQDSPARKAVSFSNQVTTIPLVEHSNVALMESCHDTSSDLSTDFLDVINVEVEEAMDENVESDEAEEASNGCSKHNFWSFFQTICLLVALLLNLIYKEEPPG